MKLSLRSRLSIEGVVTALLVLLFYHPLLRFGSMLTGGDAANLFWPVKILIQRSMWGDGVVPLWNPFSYMGAPLAASMQHAVFYPPDWLLYGALPAHIGMNVGNLFHLVLAGCGAWAWLRFGHRLNGVVSVLLGAAFPCVAWFWGHQEHINQVAATSYLPVLATITWLYIRGRLAPGIFCAAYAMLATFQFMTGHPQEAFYAHLFCLMLVAGRYIIIGGRGPCILHFIGVYAAAGLISGLMVAVQLLPTLELQKHSRRQFKDPTYAISFSMPPDLLLTYFAPHLYGSFRDGYFAEGEAGNPLFDEAGNPAWDRRAYGEYGLYVGIPALLLFILAPILDRRRRRVYILLCAIIGVAWILALGGNTDPSRIIALDFSEFPAPGYSIHEVFLKIFPPAQGFRVPARIVVLAAFCFITGAAIGLQAIGRRAGRGTSRTGVYLLIGMAVLLSLYIPSRKEKYHYPADVSGLAELIAQEPPARTLDNRMFRLTHSDDGRLINERHLETTFLDGNPIMTRYLALQPHMNVIPGVPLVDGYEEGLVPTARYKDFTYEFNRNMRQFRPDGDFLSLLGVARIYTDLPVDPEAYPVKERTALGWPMHTNPRARGAGFPRAATEGADLSRIDGPFFRGGEPHQGYYTVQIDFGDLDRWDAEWASFATSLPSVNRVEVSGDQQTDVLLAMGWFPGWVFEPSGEEVRWLNAVHADLPAEAAGNGEVATWNLAYRPNSYRIGLFLTAIGAALWAGLVALLIAGRRRRVFTIA